jgi:hypothetical protein
LGSQREKEIEMKASTFILTGAAALALAVPAANAASTSNRLYQAKAHTVLAENAQKALATRQTAKTAAHRSARATVGEYPGQVYTLVTVGSTSSLEPKPTAANYIPAPAQ